MAENGAIVARAPASHVATGEWQSFELRMRRRRAERCLLRAEIALEAGYPEDAREALDEARRLAPGVGGLADLEGRIAAACVTEPSSPQSSRVLPIAIAALFATVVFVTTFVIVRSGLARDASARTTTSDPVAVSRGVPALVSLAPRAAEEALSTPAVENRRARRDPPGARRTCSPSGHRRPMRIAHRSSWNRSPRRRSRLSLSSRRSTRSSSRPGRQRNATNSSSRSRCRRRRRSRTRRRRLWRRRR
ncbi:MAG: hypothetical protein DMF85_19220 [Acidobacteria bacterium]|nr:MAG: hypothetical protein DMF85_19220 [Acidobacteriota bacterium]